MKKDRLVSLREDYGQSVWIDFISRDALLSGELARFIADGVVGLTTNPTILERAILAGTAYDADIATMAAHGKSAPQVYEVLALADITAAADLLRPVYDRSGGADGFVNFEVPPSLAHDTAATMAEAKRLFGALGRPNVMIKVPGTPEGIAAVAGLIGAGINVNVTLLFAQNVYESAAHAYLDGLDILERSGGDLAKVAGAASFFVSRVDTAIDKLVADPALRGKAAISNAKLVYARFQQIFAGARWEALARRGARVQRPLWASTGTKNPNDSDTQYVDSLIGPNTVTTLPPATLHAFRDHGRLGQTLTADVADASTTMAQLAAAGVSLDQVTQDLLRAGIASFALSDERILAAIEAKVIAVR